MSALVGLSGLHLLLLIALVAVLTLHRFEGADR